MNVFTPAEFTANYSAAGQKKTVNSTGKLFFLAILAGALIAFAAVFSSTAAHNLETAGATRMVSGLLFAFGLGIVVITGAELFTGNCLISISVLDKKATLGGMIRNLVIVYIGNFVGSLLVAFACANCGQFNYSDNGLAVYTIKLAIGKCTLTFGNAVVLGILCNVLVCLGVLVSLAAKDIPGRIMGAYVPVAIFVIAGFEHSIANMYYVPAGLFAAMNPTYAQAAADAGLNMAALTWGNFFVHNLIPVTIGNIIGGVAVGAPMWYANLYQGKK